MIKVRNTVRGFAAGLAALLAMAGFVVALAGPAQAAVPDHWGFAYVDKPSVPGIPDPTHQAGSWPAPFKVHVTPGAVGQVFVRFPQIASKGGVVHVTAVIARPAWCQAQKWGPSGTDEIATVRCFKPGGAPVFVPFVVMFTTSTKGPFPAGRAYGYVHFEPASGIVTQFNSVGAVNMVTPGPVGVWTVTMPGLGTPGPAGNVQVTAVNPAVAAKCEVDAWASSAARQVFQVRCFDGGSTPLKTGWNLTYQRRRAVTGNQPKLFAYTFDNKPLLAGPYAPAPPPVNFNSAGAVNTIQTAGAGLRLVNFPGVGVLPNTVLVSAFHTGPGFCNLNTLWATTAGAPQVIVRDVACYTAAGVLKSQPSLITYASAS
jgi:hypothetical protein